MALYEIPKYNIETLKNRLKKIENKCKKYGEGLTFKIVDEGKKEVSKNTIKMYVPTYICEVEGNAKIDDWEFIGSIEHYSKGNIIKSMKSEKEIPSKYYHTEGFCDHCNSDRNRKSTFLIRNVKTGEYKQVGRQCLKLYTNGLSAENVAWVLELIDLMEKEDCSDGFFPNGVSKSECVFEIPYILTLSFAVTDKYGYVKKSDVYYNEGVSTFTRVLEMLDKEEFIDVKDPRVDEVIDYIKSSDSDTLYMNNLKSIVNNNFVSLKDIALLISAVKVLENKRNKEAKEAEEALRKSKEAQIEKKPFEGKEGDKVTIDVLSARCVYTFTQSSYSYYSSDDSYSIYLFLGSDGNKYSWTTTKYLGEEEDLARIKTIRGTVKGFKDYKGENQIVLTRVKVVSEEPSNMEESYSYRGSTEEDIDSFYKNIEI